MLLVFFLISVKIFKSAYRWRSSFSNEFLESMRFKKAPINFENQSIFVNNCSLTKNSACAKKNKFAPIIVMLRTNRKKRLLNLLTEGLSTYGFTVVNLNFKIKPHTNCDVSDQTIKDETTHAISAILNYFKQNNLIQNSNFFLILNLKSFISYNAVLSDSKNVGMVIINPILNSINLKNLSELIDNIKEKKISKSHICIIFSEKSSLNLNNNNLKVYLKEFQALLCDKVKLLTLRKARNSYKYYETILLGLIIECLEKCY